jgi:hypothetical protein
MNKGLEAARAARLANKDKPRVKKPSMRKAINDFCKECSYDPFSAQGTWRQQVEAVWVAGVERCAEMTDRELAQLEQQLMDEVNE